MNDRLIRRRTTIALCGALLASVGAKALTPSEHLADKLGQLNLERDVPREFGDWSVEPLKVMSVVNPQQEELLKQLYSQILERIYKHKDGYRIIVSVAYGGDQRETLHAHYPEVCYAAQGFKIRKEQIGQIEFAGRILNVRRLDAALGQTRPEPVTYWLVVGEHAVLGGYKKKLVDLNYTMRGLIPDGLLFRVSSIDPNLELAFERQSAFIQEILAAMRSDARIRLAGL